MKKLSTVAIGLVCLLGLSLIGWSLGPPVTSNQESLPTPLVGTMPVSLGVAAPAPAPRFVDLPVGKERVVDFAADASALEQMTPREQRDQFIDWLLFAAASSAGLTPEQFNQSLYDVPALRHGYMRPVANLEYGETRSCSIGDGQILALIPTCEGVHRAALLADVADAHRKNLGAEPRTVTVIEYQLDPVGQSARLTRREDVDGHHFFTQDAGYYQRAVGSLDEMKEFLEKVDDVTFASFENGSLALGGRKIADHKHPQARAEDFAAIWQAEHKLHKELSELDSWVKSKQDAFNAESKTQFEALEAQWKQRIDRINQRLRAGLARKKTALDFTPPITLPRAGDNEGMPDADNSLGKALVRLRGARERSLTGLPGKAVRTNPLLGTRFGLGRTLTQVDDDFETATVIDEDAIRLRENADFEALKKVRREKWKLVQAEITAEQDKHKLVRGSGFSLDPEFDFKGLASFVGKLLSEFEDFNRGSGPVAINDAELNAIRDGLGRDDLAPFRALLDRLEQADGPLSRKLYDTICMLWISTRFGGELDVPGVDTVLSRLETELNAISEGRLPDGTRTDLRAVSKALTRGDEAPLRAWLDRMRKQGGPLGKALFDLVSTADDRYHFRSVTDRAGLDIWLARIEEESGALTSDQTPSAVWAELREATEAAKRGDDAPAKKLIARWKASDSILVGTLGDWFTTTFPGYRFRGRLDSDGLARQLARIDKGLKSLVVGDQAALSPGAIREIRAAIAKGDDAPFRNLLAREKERDNRRFVESMIFTRLARATTPFRACDREGLAFSLDQADTCARTLATGNAPVLSAADVKRGREALKKGDLSAIEPLLFVLDRPQNPLAVALMKDLVLEVDVYRDQNLKGLAKVLDKIGPKLRGLGAAASFSDLRAASRALSSETKTAKGRGKEAEQAIVPLLKWNDHLRKAKNPTANYLAQEFEREIESYRFQMARYDGDLKGTEVGMVLFYTDLLAKLWAIDYMDSQPAREIDDFHSMTDLTISPVFEEEIRKLPSTRLWFGHEDKGFQVAGDGNVLILGRNATRIYAASSNPLAPGAEVPAAANSEAFLGWWNDHYLDVARYEPQYERLNEIMKWSLLISWLNEKNRGDSLGFLGEVTVDHSHCFPDWVRTRPELRFRRWDRVSFYDPGYKGSATEAMPILSSEEYVQFGRIHTLAGGVSLAPKELFNARVALAEEVSPLLRRSNLDYAARSTTGEGLMFKTLQESQYTFRPVALGKSVLEVVPKAGTKFRGRLTEIMAPRAGSAVVEGGAAVPNFGRTVSAEAGRWEIAAKVGERELAVLSIQPTRNGLRVGLRSRELATGQSLARRASVSLDPVEAVARHPGVEATLGTSEGVFARLRGSKSWLKLTAEPSGAASVESAEGSVARVADTKAGARTYDLAFVDEPAAKAALGKGESVAIRIPESGGEGLPIRLSARGPPADAPLVSVEIEWDGGTIRGRFDPKTRELHVDRNLLPSDLLDNPEQFRTLIRKSELPSLKLDPTQTGTVRLVVKEAQFGEGRLLRDVEEGRFRPAASELADDPSGFSKKIKDQFEKTLHACDDLIRQHEDVRALQTLSSLEDVFGTRPEIQFRQAVAEIKAGRPGRAARIANEAMESPRVDLRKLYEEINIRLTDPHLDPTTRANLGRLRDASDWHSLQAVSEAPKGRIELSAVAEQIRLNYHVDQNLSFGESVPEARVLKTNAPVYIMDMPGFNNLDWGPSFQETLHGLVQGGVAKVVSLPDAAIAEFRPTQIFVGEKTATATASKTTAYTNVRPSYASPANPASATGPAASGSGGDDDEEKKRMLRLAALLARAEGVPREAFVILPVGAAE